MNLKKLIGFGVLIYVVVFVIISIFVAYDMGESLATSIVGLIGIVVVTCLASRSIKASSIGEAIKYSIGWLIIVAILDALITLRFVDTGWTFFSSWNVIVGYLIILLLPLICVKCCGAKDSSQPAAPAAPSMPAESADSAPQGDEQA